jgi:hypothetical protein
MTGVLFISNKCTYCMELVHMIDGMSDMNFKIDVIDIKNMQKLPGFIDRVPLLLIEKDNKLLHDEELFEFVKKCEKTIEPFMINEMRGLSDRYSFMGEEEEQKLDHQYVFLENGDPIITSSTLSEEENKKLLDYDRFLEARDKDINTIFEKQNPATKSQN